MTRFVPSVDDILHCRVKTLGIVEMKFNYQGSDFMMVDVGGQRTERRKWIHAFGDVTLLMFVASLADYSTACEEDRKTNRLLESLKLFEEVVNNVFLAHVSLVIFYNKNDLFEEQLPLIPFASYHTE
jgi:signal recognition particle receptor subunit beta